MLNAASVSRDQHDVQPRHHPIDGVDGGADNHDGDRDRGHACRQCAKPRTPDEQTSATREESS